MENICGFKKRPRCVGCRCGYSFYHFFAQVREILPLSGTIPQLSDWFQVLLTRNMLAPDCEVIFPQKVSSALRFPPF